MSKRVKEAPRAEPFLGVRHDGNGKSELVAMESMMQKLESLDDSIKLGVFFLGGPMRGGKSTTMTHGVVGYWGDKAVKDGFQCGHSTTSCTIGMNAWSELIDGFDPNTGEPMKILAVDTEGVGSFGKHAGLNHDAKILSMSALLASCFAVNYHGPININALDYIKQIVDMCDLIQSGVTEVSTSSINGEPGTTAEGVPPSTTVATVSGAPLIVRDQVMTGGSSRLSFTVPRFRWLARDWELVPEDERTKQPITPQEYFENALRSCGGKLDRVRSFFPVREFIPVPPPRQFQKQSNKIVELKREECNPEYVGKMDHLLNQVRRDTPIKTDAHGQPVNGRVFVHMMRLYIDAFNNGGMPDLDEAHAAMSNVRCLSAKGVALRNWKDVAKKEKLDNLSPGEMNKRFATMMARAIDDYSTGPMKAYGDCFDKVLRELKDEVKEWEVEYRERNQEHVRTVVIRELDQIQLTMNDCVDFDAFTQLVEKVRQTIFTKLHVKSTDTTTYVYQSLCQEIAGRWDTWVIMFSARLVGREKKLMKDIQERDDNIKRMKQFMEDKDRDLDRLERDKVDLEKEHQQALVTLQAQSTEERERVEVQIEQMRQSQGNELKGMQADLEDAQTRETTSRQELANTVQVHHQQTLETDQKLQQLQEQLTTVDNNAKSLEAHNTELMQQVRDMTVFRVEAGTLKQECASLQSRLDAAQQEMAKSRKQYTEKQNEYLRKLQEDGEKTDQLLSDLQRKFQCANDDLRAQLKEHEVHIAQSEKARGEAETELQSVQASLRDTTKAHEKAHTKLQRELESVQKSAQEAAEHARQQREHVEAFHRSEAEKLAARLEAQRQTANERTNELEQQLVRIREDIASRDRVLSENKIKIQSLEQARDTLREQVGNSRTLESNLQQEKMVTFQQKHELQRLSDRVAKLQSEVQEHKDAAERERERCMQIQTRAQEEIQAKKRELLEASLAVGNAMNGLDRTSTTPVNGAGRR